MLLLLFYAGKTSAQNHIMGHVFEMDNGKKVFLPGVNVYVAGTTTATSTNNDGMFMMDISQTQPVTLVASFVGYEPDTVILETLPALTVGFNLKKSITLKAVEVKSKRESTTISTISTINSTIINKDELLKAACCNLSESFETNPTVDVNFTDAVTGAKQIQILGLDGIYTQIQAENIPFVRGLSASYGLGFIPGTFIESIQINKGAGSVVNGYESITGQVNIELKKPISAENFFLNGYINNELRSEANAQVAGKISKHAWSELLIHGSELNNKTDHNNDGFLDAPLFKAANVYNRWQLQYAPRFEAQIGVRAVYEDRTGGQKYFNYNDDFGTDNFYGIGIKNKMAEAFTKTGFLFPEKPWKSIGIINNIRYHEQESYFGLKTFDGIQKSYYGNAIYQTIYGDTRNTFKNGFSFVYNDYSETYNSVPEKTIEQVPGVFSEYSFNDEKQIAYVAGIRYDYHNNFGGFLSPRLHFKYNLTQLTAFRISGGRGWRTARVFTENTKIFPNNRYIYIAENLKPESAWNYGISFTHKLRIFKHDASFNLDYYRTDFQNQVIADMENIHYIYFYNLKGQSFANSISAELNFEPFNRFEIRLAYKYNDVKTTYGQQLLEKPLSPKNKALINLAYKTQTDSAQTAWKFDFTARYNGQSRIPGGGFVHHNVVIPSTGDAFILLQSQITCIVKRFDFYIGGENLTDYTQHLAIIDPENPFGGSFDASLVWGPLMGRTFYAGFRYTLK